MLNLQTCKTIIYHNNIDINFNIIKNIISSNYEITNWVTDSTIITDLIFPKESKESNNNSPFKFCPIKLDKLYLVSNNSIFNICIFDSFDIIIGFIIISEKKKYYWINVICTQQKNGIGTYLIKLTKLLVNKLNKITNQNKPIKLSSTSNAIKFYKKMGFKIEFVNIMEYYFI